MKKKQTYDWKSVWDDDWLVNNEWKTRNQVAPTSWATDTDAYTATTVAEYLKKVDKTDRIRLEIEREDNTEQTFTVNGDASSFKCVPARTSNFKVFCLVNQGKICEQTAHEIWEYYREKFIIAKMRGVNLTPFRAALEEFVSEKNDPTNIKKSYKLSRMKDGDTLGRKKLIEDCIGLARYLELQYNVDKSIESVCKGYDVPTMVNKTRHLCEYANEPQDMYSYFKTAAVQETDWSIYEDRKLTVKKVYKWTHRETYHYICDSEYGPVKFCIPRTSKPMIRLFDRLITEGTDIVVTQGKVMNNIDDTPFLLAERWFIQ